MRTIEPDEATEAYNTMMSPPFMQGMLQAFKLPRSVPSIGDIRYAKNKAIPEPSAWEPLVKQHQEARKQAASFLREIMYALEKME